MNKINELNIWRTLLRHQHDVADEHMRNWFSQDETRLAEFSMSTDELLLDYSRNRITSHTLDLLIELANTLSLSENIEALFRGDVMNKTEARPALHTALRDQKHQPLWVKGKNIADLIRTTQERMKAFTRRIHHQEWRGATGKPIKHIVNIGIGGSYLGPLMCTTALKDFAVNEIQFHFISSVDPTHVQDVLQQIDPYSTLFIISSKSFSTLETMTNANTMVNWMRAKVGENALSHHFIAVTAAIDKAVAFGIPADHIFPLWEWVGGRYSIWSAIGLPLMLMIGEQGFADFMAGAHHMDEHFRHAAFTHNMPVILALLGIWYMNFFGCTVHAIVPYANRLRYLIPYLQQVDMESNGKTINIGGCAIPYATGPVIFGEEGCNGQHAYHQLLHQGQHLIPVDFILVGQSSSSLSLDDHQDIVLASGISQAQALMRGKTYTEAYDELRAKGVEEERAEVLAHHQVVPGNRPSNILFLNRLTPKNLGALIALYEHKIFVQGIIWNINSFDQWGVELGKQLLPDILKSVQNSHHSDKVDPALQGIIQHFKTNRGKS